MRRRLVFAMDTVPRDLADALLVDAMGPLRMAVVASPQYFASHPVPSRPHDLRDHRCINFRLASAGTLYKWEFEKARHGVEVRVEGPLISGDIDIVTDAARDGVGLGTFSKTRLPRCSRPGRW